MAAALLEVLKDKDSSSDAATALIDRWRQETSILTHEEADSIRSRLAYLKSISISRGIGSVVKRHLGQDRVKEARDLYAARSSLVHYGIRPTDSVDTGAPHSKAGDGIAYAYFYGWFPLITYSRLQLYQTTICSWRASMSTPDMSLRKQLIALRVRAHPWF
jgi:hypothetical protein